MIKIANNLENLITVRKKEAGVQDFLASLIPIATGIGAGYAGHNLSGGNMPAAIASSLLGSVAGVPLVYLLSSDKIKKRFKKHPEEAFTSFGLVF